MKIIGWGVTALIAFAVIAVLHADAAEASTRKCHSSPYSGAIKVTARNSGACAYGAMVVDDLTSLHPNAIWRKGTHTYTIPRHGTNYRRGEDYRCRMTVRSQWNAEVGHPVMRASGSCTYMRRSSTRFRFDTGWFA
jgi:hypothetical protein